MSKIIRMTPKTIADCTKEFEAALKSSKLMDGKISYNKILGTIDRKAKLCFAENAWLKMQTLIREYSKEVAWHGVVTRRDNPEMEEYFISDILVYPQEVGAATVDMDVAGYDKWLRDNWDDERFFNIRMQGHSHVNMATTPSGTDIKHQAEILEQIGNDMFYIFVIWNKSGAKDIKIYDLEKNILFETADVEVEVEDDDTGINAFMREAKELVREKTYNTPSYGGYGGSYGGSYGGNNASNGQPNTAAPGNGNASTQSTPKNTIGFKATDEKKDVPVKVSKGAVVGKTGKRKGKKNKNKNKHKSTFQKFESYDDDYGYPYGYSYESATDPFYADGK